MGWVKVVAVTASVISLVLSVVGAISHSILVIRHVCVSRSVAS